MNGNLLTDLEAKEWNVSHDTMVNGPLDVGIAEQ